MKLGGVYTALVTPFCNGRLDVETLKRLVERQIGARVSGIVPLGTTGENPTLSHRERTAIIEAVVEQCRKRVTVIAGCGSNSTATAIAWTKEAKSIGADASLQVVPYYNKPNQEGLYRHFSSIADAVDLPMVLYNVPGRSAANMSAQTAARLFEHPNILGVKEASNDLPQIMEVLSALPPQRYVLSGEDSLAYSIIALGGHGVISVAANLFPQEVREMVGAAVRGQCEQAMRAHYQLLPFFRACFYDTNPIPLKYAMAQRGLIRLEYRLPLVAPAAEVKRRIDAVMRGMSGGLEASEEAAQAEEAARQGVARRAPDEM